MNTIPDLAKLFDAVDRESPVIVAVSGGSDSLALLHLTSSWAKQTDVELKVVTVDHGLRPEAAAEAAYVAGICEGLYLNHYTLSWEGMKPTSGLSEAAREARYLLLSEFAEDVGANVVLTGHTCDDQAETVWMRNSRGGEGTQARGLAGMANSMQLPSGVIVKRPLLGLTRKELRRYLRDIGQSWIEDPSNDDASFERVRVRQVLGEVEISAAEIARFATLAGRQRRLISSAVAKLLTNALQLQPGLVFAVDQSALETPIEAVNNLAVRIMVAMAGGRKHLISEDLAEQILHMTAGERLSAGHAIVECHSNVFRFYREKRHLDFIEIQPGKKVVWDNRLVVDNQSDRGFVCTVLSRKELLEFETQWQMKLEVQPRAALLSMPVLLRDDGELAFPFLEYFECEPGLELKYRIPAIEHFCPDFDFPLLDVADRVRLLTKLENISPDI
ncbi:MAG: tRNA lysidine(34) synthetase TilS [Pseudomonadota bacterium]